MSLSASSVSGSLCPFVACPSHVCFGGAVRGAPEDDADGRGLVLGLVDEEEEEDLGLAVLFGVVPVRLGGVPRSGSGWSLLLGFHL